MRLGEKDRTPYEIESEKEDVPAHPEPAPMRHEPRRDTILRAPIRLAGPRAEAAKDAMKPAGLALFSTADSPSAPPHRPS